MLSPVFVRGGKTDHQRETITMWSKSTPFTPESILAFVKELTIEELDRFVELGKELLSKHDAEEYEPYYEDEHADQEE
jgi:hypothetical protein